MHCRTRLAVVIAAVGCLYAANTAHAQLVTYKFTGVVTDVDPNLVSEFTIGDDVWGSYTFGLATPDSDASTHSGQYVNPYTAFNVYFSSGYSVALGGGGGVTDILTTNDFMIDVYSPAAGVTGANVGGVSPEYFTLNLVANLPSNLVTSDDLPLSPPDLSLADLAQGVLRFSDFSFVDYNVTSLTSVPEPASCWLLVLGLGCALITYIKRQL